MVIIGFEAHSDLSNLFTNFIILSRAREAGSQLKATARVQTRPLVPFIPFKKVDYSNWMRVNRSNTLHTEYNLSTKNIDKTIRHGGPGMAQYNGF